MPPKPTATRPLWRALTGLFLLWLVLGSWDTYRYAVEPPHFEYDGDAEGELQDATRIGELEDLLEDDLRVDDAWEEDPWAEDAIAPEWPEGPEPFDSTALDNELESAFDDEPTALSGGSTEADGSEALVLGAPPSDTPSSIEALRTRLEERARRLAAERDAVAARDDAEELEEALDLDDLTGAAGDPWDALESEVETVPGFAEPALELVRADDFVPRKYALDLLQIVIALLLLLVARRERDRLNYFPGALLLAASLLSLSSTFSEGILAMSWLWMLPSRPLPVLACALVALGWPKQGKRIAGFLGVTYVLTAAVAVFELGPQPHWLGGGVVLLVAVAAAGWSCALVAKKEPEPKSADEGPFRTAAPTSEEAPSVRLPLLRAAMLMVSGSVAVHLLCARMALGISSERYAYEAASVSIGALLAVAIFLSREAHLARAEERRAWRRATAAAWAVWVLQVGMVTAVSWRANHYGLWPDLTAGYAVLLGVGLGLQLVFCLRAMHATAARRWDEPYALNPPTSGELLRVMFGAVGLALITLHHGDFDYPDEVATLVGGALITAVLSGGYAFIKRGWRYQELVAAGTRESN